MNPEQANVVVATAEGYWPTPEMREPEVVAWFEVLTGPEAITQTEGQAFFRRAAYRGQVHRPRPGELVAAIRAERRARQRIERTAALASPPLTDDERAAGLKALRAIKASLR